MIALGEAARYILTPNGETPLGEQYFYRENGGLQYVITLVSRKESQERVNFEARLDDILWRKGRYDIGDTITFGCQKKFYYPLWWLKTLSDGLQEFVDRIPSIEKINELYPDIDMSKEEDVIRLIKIANAEMEARYQSDEE